MQPLKRTESQLPIQLKERETMHNFKTHMLDQSMRAKLDTVHTAKEVG